MKLFENTTFYQNLLPYEAFRFYADLPENAEIGEYEKKIIMESAEKALEEEIPQLYATVYMRFVRDGNRGEYEASYFKRRAMLRALTMGEVLEKKGRFIDKIINIVWLICEETTWVIPAHNHGDDTQDGTNTLLTCEVEDEVRIIDLFAAETGAELSNTLYYLRDELEAVTPSITRRMDYCIEKHILTPFEKYYFWWGGYHGGILNNWNPWIISNILITIAVEVRNPVRRENLTEKAAATLDRFTASYSPDGGCDEGPSYWTAAAASLYDCLEILYDMTGGKVNCMENELVRNMCDYFRKAYISGPYVMNFADAPATMEISGVARTIKRMGRRVGIPELETFASYAAYRKGEKQAEWSLSTFESYRNIRNLYETIPPYTGGGCAETAAFPGISVLVAREKADFDEGLYFAMKGGTNGESHNHNDIGNLVVYKDGKPVIVDIGVGTYSRKTFSEERYTIKPMTSPYHNTLEIGGFAQPAGITYKSENTVYAPDGKGMKINLEKAYPAEAGVLSYTREGALKDGRITVTDEVSLDAEKELIFNFISFEKPEITPSGVSLGACEMTFEDSLTPSVEEYVFDDVRFNNTWKRDGVWRIRLKGKAKAGKFTFVIQ